MTQTTDTIIDRSTTQEIDLHRPNSVGLTASEPSIQQILYHAIDRGVDVATLERLVALKERVDAEKAEKELNAALRRFRDGCPQILKTREVKGKEKVDDNRKVIPPQVMYRYANLEDVKGVVDPRLAENDLSYSWDTDFTAGVTTTTCTIRHVGGGKRSSRFSSGQAGAPATNAAQAAGSTVSYGQRYSLLAVLGISADLDDDGRMSNALPKPEADPTQPAGVTRDERQRAQRAAHESTSVKPAPAPSAVSAAQIGALLEAWKAGKGRHEPTPEAFAYFVDVALGYQEPSGKTWLNVSMWGAEQMTKCMEAVK